MSARDAFGVAVRVFGLIALFHSIQHLFTLLSIQLGSDRYNYSITLFDLSGAKGRPQLRRAGSWLEH
jgi:hypothetical protein